MMSFLHDGVVALFAVLGSVAVWLAAVLAIALALLVAFVLVASYATGLARDRRDYEQRLHHLEE